MTVENMIYCFMMVSESVINILKFGNRQDEYDSRIILRLKYIEDYFIPSEDIIDNAYK